MKMRFGPFTMRLQNLSATERSRMRGTGDDLHDWERHRLTRVDLP